MRDAQNFNISQEQEQEIKDHFIKMLKIINIGLIFMKVKIQKEIII